MLPTIERAPRRSKYSSATRQSVAVSGARRRPRRGLAAEGVPVASISATRVSPRSTLTSTCFFTEVLPFLEAQAPAPQRSGGPPLRVDGLQEADRQERGDHRRPSVAHERERDAGDGHDPYGHADVDEYLEQEHRDDEPGDDGAEEVLRHRQDE